MVTPFPSILMLHLFKNLQHHLISGLRLAVSLWVVWGRPSMLDVIYLSQPLHVFVYEQDPMVVDQSPGDPKPCNDIFLNEVCYSRSDGFFQRDGLYPFCKILYGC